MEYDVTAGRRVCRNRNENGHAEVYDDAHDYGGERGSGAAVRGQMDECNHGSFEKEDLEFMDEFG